MKRNDSTRRSTVDRTRFETRARSQSYHGCSSHCYRNASHRVVTPNATTTTIKMYESMFLLYARETGVPRDRTHDVPRRRMFHSFTAVLLPESRASPNHAPKRRRALDDSRRRCARRLSTQENVNTNDIRTRVGRLGRRRRRPENRRCARIRAHLTGETFQQRNGTHTQQHRRRRHAIEPTNGRTRELATHRETPHRKCRRRRR